MNYQHQYVDGTTVHFPLGKVVCIGRNYAEHAAELNNPVPTEPLLFIKPGSCVVPLEGGFVIPEDRGSVHYEAEIAVLIGKPLSKKPDAEEVRDAISGFAPALDLTLRDVQTKLKEKGYPWEIAKSFDGACVLAPFVPGDAIEDLADIGIRLVINGETRQFPAPLNCADLVTQLDLSGKRIAIERNGEIVPKSQHATTILGNGDQLVFSMNDTPVLPAAIPASVGGSTPAPASGGLKY